MITTIDKIRLSIFPLIILLLNAIFFYTIFIFTDNLFYRLLTCFVCIYPILISVRLFQALPLKVRSVLILFRKNRLSIKPVSFENYMVAPCGRQVVKIVLNKLNRTEQYPILRKKFPISIFLKKRPRTRIVYYKDGEQINLLQK